MKISKINLILSVVLAILITMATTASLLSNANDSFSKAEPKGNVSIAITGDVMFARDRKSVV